MTPKRTICPRCGECPFSGGVCEEKVSRGRRFFMLGALALPVAAQIARVAAVIAPPLPETSVTLENTSGSAVYLWTGQTIQPGDLLVISSSMRLDGQYLVTKAGSPILAVRDPRR